MMKTKEMNLKEKNPGKFKTGLGKIVGYSRKYGASIIIGILLIICSTVIQVIAPDKLRILTEEIVKMFTPGVSANFQVVKNISILLLILYGISMIADIIQGLIFATITEYISFDLRSDLSSKMNVLPLNYYDTTNKGDYISRVTNDVDTIGQTLGSGLNGFLTSVILLIGSAFMMFYTNWLLAGAAILASLLGFSLVAIILKGSQKFFTRQQKEIGTMSGFLEETYSNHEVIGVYNAKELTKEKFVVNNEALKDSAWKSQFFSGSMSPLMAFIGNLGYVVVSVVGAVLVKQGHISIGVIAAFMIYVRLFTQPLNRIAQSITTFQRTSAAANRVFDILEEEELTNEDNKTLQLVNPEGVVEFNNINFGYIEGQEIIKDFTVHINKGEKIAIVGPTGAGKTTIVNLLMRFYELKEGNILIDGIDISQVTRENLHDQFSMVLQESWIFHGSIYENIKYTVDASLDEVIEVCKSIGLHHFIKTLPNGYHTVVRSEESLSQGQRQLITIARAMIKDSPLLILDEATSSVDTRTELIIQKAMDKLMEGRTSFVIAHRLSTIRNSDLILVMKDGSIIEQGNHDELINLGKFYANLYNSQFEV